MRKMVKDRDATYFLLEKSPMKYDAPSLLLYQRQESFIARSTGLAINLREIFKEPEVDANFCDIFLHFHRN